MKQRGKKGEMKATGNGARRKVAKGGAERTLTRWSVRACICLNLELLLASFCYFREKKHYSRAYSVIFFFIRVVE